MNKTIIFFFCSALLLLVLFFWINPQSTESEIKYKTAQSDYFFEDLSIKHFDVTGELIHKIHANRLEHFATEEISFLKNPRITLEENVSNHWRIKADIGQIRHKNNLLIMRNKVIVELLPETQQNTTPQIQINTDHLDFDLLTNIINIKKHITEINYSQATN